MSKARIYWISDIPTHCEMPHAQPHPIDRVFIDGGIGHVLGPWGIICRRCHLKHGLGIGPGRGQRYEKQPDGRFLKVAG